MKFLLLVLVIALAVWMITRRRGPPAPRPPRDQAAPPKADPAPMLACARCGVHLPQAEALTDSAGRPYCSEAHRGAGPQ